MDGATTRADPAPVAYFSEALPGTATPGTATLRLAAAVVWRGVPTPAALSGGGGPLGWLRSVRHRIWLRLGPLGADVSIAGRPLFGGDAFAARGVSSFGLAPHGEPLAYYDEGSRVLRVLGRVVAAPPRGRTLVALVDATGPHATAPRLVLRIVPTPTITVQRPQPALPAGAESTIIVGEHPAWTSALRADPVVRAFLDGPPPDRAERARA
jgi:hypothetical protein